MNYRRWILAALGAVALAPGSAVAQVETVQTVETEAGTVAVQSLAEGLEHPWGMAFLPDGRLLVTERPGRLRILDRDHTLSEPVEGTPEVFDAGQGGLLDVALDPDFRDNRLVYLSFAESGPGGASTALGRGRLADGRLEDFEVIFRQRPKVSGDAHFGGRIAFSPEGHLFLTMGERFKFEPAQAVANHLGTIVRLNRDGSAVESNPFVGDADARDEIWSYGHRNIEAAAIDPQSGDLWIAEMGPRGGDELNRPQAGRNYGWPVVSWGRHYSGLSIPDPPTHPEFADAVHHWTPVISPSGMIFYTGSMFPDWKGDMFIGGLSAQALVRLVVRGGEYMDEQRIDLGTRIRDVEQGPDGAIHVLTDEDDGDIWRLVPAEE